jgi:hypothetical protein
MSLPNLDVITPRNLQNEAQVAHAFMIQRVRSEITEALAQGDKEKAEALDIAIEIALQSGVIEPTAEA